MILLDRVVAVLDDHDVPHALIGAAALAARGIARSTYDIDLLYAGGAQDIWDVRELLRLPGAEQVIDEVTADLAQHSREMRELWAENPEATPAFPRLRSRLPR